ncbi:hypothetical protein B0T10DRAFT_414530 [Thelonectria olida]|uniref:Uncharacterized protein n=1 Tax=Thelonectria olida TaxID=1576542 RepID=A0A9P8VW83_9HYPO|nr:hypothetical protein B0T10DRAFT_414530 [Thelonectria olida]
MHTHQLLQIHLGAQPHNYEPVARDKAKSSIYLQDEAKLETTLLGLCPANLWHNGSYAAGSPRPILIGKHHQQQMEDLHEALTAAITDVVQRWWTDGDARFPERMPLEKEEEELLKWLEGEVSQGNLPRFSARLGSWRPDFLVEDDEDREENFRITEINARFSFNGFMHEAYGQQALNDSLRGPEGEPSGLVGATDPQAIVNGLFSLFQPHHPLHLLKGAEKGIDIHMFVDAVWRRFGIKPRLITPADLRLLPDPDSNSGHRLCCLVKNRPEDLTLIDSPTFVTKDGEIVEEIHQVGLELHQRELVAMEPEMLRQVSLRCFNDMRTILLVHDKRMLGILKQEIPQLVARGVLTPRQADALDNGVVETILPGSRELDGLLYACSDSPQLKNQYILKPIRSGKGDGIIFGVDFKAEEWMSALACLRNAAVVPGVSCVVQRRITPRVYDMVLKGAAGMVRYPLVGTYHVANGKLLGLGTWRASGGRVVAVSSGGSSSIMSEAPALPLACATLALTTVFCLPAIIAVYAQLQSRKPKDHFYEDSDGCGIPKSIADFSNRPAKSAILLFSALGVGTSIANLVFSSVRKDDLVLESSLRMAAWVIRRIHDYRDIIVTIRLTDPIFALALGIASTTLPRRPDVFFKKCKVDRQWTVSALNRFTWTWVQPLLRHASIHNDVGTEDVPQPDANLRAENLKQHWDMLNTTTAPSLFRTLMGVYRVQLALLWTVTLLRCLVSILPFWSMFRILGILEDPTSRGSQLIELLALITCMTASNLLDAWIEGWAYWYSLSAMALPIRSQLSSLVFDKALRRKNVKAPNEEDHRPDSNEDMDEPKKNENATPPEDGSVLRSNQAIVNLVGIDTERLSYFVQYHFLILNGVVKLLIFSTFLLQLLGWIPFLAGIIAWALTLPANTWFSKRVLVQSRSLMKLRDGKLSKINEVLLGMRQIKFSALESQWERRILALRDAELRSLWRFFLADSGLFACWVISPILLAVASLATYVLINSSLSASVAFVSIGIFNTLETTLGSLPELFTLGLDSLVSIRRINAYLDEPERAHILDDGPTISFEGASISWPVGHRTAAGEDRFILHGVDLSFPDGALSVISGKTGAGKTLLLSAILGEADLLQGSIRVPKPQDVHLDGASPDGWTVQGSVAYISQTPWLENTSLRNNILFGLPLVKTRYDEVIEACALREDIAALVDGDDTELGANGVNLSGGQKWRITLARAIYSQAEILIMEDIFSAVDAHVGSWIFERCLTGDICKGRTRILVTHHLGLVLPRTDYLVELGEGLVTFAGQPRGRHQFYRGSGCIDDSHVATSVEEAVTAGPTNNTQNAESLDTPATVPRKFIQDETREKGTVKRGVYLTYVKSSGGLYLWITCALVFLAYQAGTIVGRAWWLRIWTSQANSDGSGESFRLLNTYHSIYAVSTPQSLFQVSERPASHHDLFFYLKVYIVISMSTALIGIIRFISSYSLAVRASRAIFQKMLFTILRSPLRWLDSVPTGRILNRFTADFSIIDERIALSWSLFFSNLLRLVGIVIASCFASVYLIPPAVLLLGLGTVTGGRYLAASRPLKRLESNAKSPVFELFNTTLTGISTIRAFQRTHTYLTEMHKSLDAWVMTTFYIALANRWMSFRMALIASLFSVAVGVVIIVNPIDAALAGLALSFILDFSESLRWTIRCYGDMELEMNSMERVIEYMSLETEPLSGDRPPSAWPSSGAIEFRNVVVSYAPDLPPVLKGLSLKIKHNERIGVVGRTGAGKSSLTLALFRFLETRSGSILIDGLDISKINLNALRSQLSIIPQDPVLFSGTVRSNLDPFGNYTDDELFETLARVQLITSRPNSDANQSTSVFASSNANIFRDLSSPISEFGGNLSQGQRQLLCISRSLLTNSKIILLDEATSAVDVVTDTLIQRSIRDGFTDRTLIVIAHRLSTIADFDRILVLENGCMVEFGTPRELWERKGTFRSMCESTGESERENLRNSILG